MSTTPDGNPRSLELLVRPSDISLVTKLCHVPDNVETGKVARHAQSMFAPAAGSAEISVRRIDLETVCRAIVEGAVYYDYNDNGPSRYECLFCDGWMSEKEGDAGGEIKHETSCAFLVARDIRPRAYKSPTPPGSATPNAGGTYGS